MSDSTVDGKQIKAAVYNPRRLLKQLHLADKIVEIAQDLSQGGADEMLEQYKKCSEENKNCFVACVKFLADYMDGLLEQKALADLIIKRVDAGEFTN